MNPYDGEADNSILDGHHVGEIIEQLRSIGILVIFLPPYSLDFNPIELTFSYLKQYLEEQEHIIKAAMSRR